MTVVEYGGSREFLKEYEAVMTGQEALSQLIISYFRISRDRELTGKDVFGAVIDEEDRTMLLFYNGKEYGLVIYEVASENIPQAVQALAQYLGSRHIAINGITAAAREICISFLEQYQKYVDCTFTEKISMDIMEIRNVTDIKPVAGVQRLATAEDTKLVAEWIVDYRLEAFTSEMDYEAALTKATDFVRRGRVFLFENEESLPVSMAVAEQRLIHGMVITFIFTPEEYRGKGYAAANIYYLSRELLDQGYEFCTLLVDKKNPLSARAYEKVGYVIIGELYEFKVIPA